MRIVFMGTPDFSVPILEQLIEDGHSVVGVVTQPDRPKGRKKTLTPPPVKEEALKHGLPVYQPKKIKEEYDDILALNPDVIVTAAFGQLLPTPVLEAPKYGCVNVHASLLPELRGGAPIHYAILQGKEKTGVTIMYMAEKLDAGDILTQVDVPILEHDHVGSLHNKLSIAGAKLLSETLPLLEKGELEPIAQNDDDATFAPNIRREDEKIDWSQPGAVIYNHIRGLHPWPVAYTMLKDQRLKLWWGEKVAYTSNEKAGTVVALEDDGFIVATGDDTSIKVTTVQPSGKKRMTAKQFIVGGHIDVGMTLGDDTDDE